MLHQRPIKLGYFVPEFPGQTHIFFWREIERLESLGVEVRIVSTRTPPRKISSHRWSDEAKGRTSYLFASLNLPSVLDLVACALRFGSAAWGRVLESIAASEVGFKGKLHLAVTALFGCKLAVLAQKEGWTHLHVHSCANAANVALFARLVSGLPYSLTLHGPLSDYGPNQAEKWAHAAFGIVITQKLFGELREALGESVTEHLVIAPMGVNLSVFQRKIPYQVWDGQSPARLYAVGRLNVCKGHDHLIRAVGLLRDRGVPVLLQIAGEDESGGTGYHLELDALIRELKLDNEVKLLGAISEEAVRAGLESSHLFTLASLHEPLGVAIMEAMALEMPVVVTGAGGVKELVDDGKDGKLVQPADPEGLADAIEALLRDPERCRSLSAQSRIKIAEQFQDTRSAEVLVSSIKALPIRKDHLTGPVIPQTSQQTS